MPSCVESQSIRLEVISAKILQVPSERTPAGIYFSITVDSRRWKSATSVLSSDKSAAWGDTVTLSLQVLPKFSMEIRVSYEVDRMLGNGELVGKLETSWDELLDHGDEPFELSFPPVRGVRPSITLKAAVVHSLSRNHAFTDESLLLIGARPILGALSASTISMIGLAGTLNARGAFYLDLGLRAAQLNPT